MKQVQKQKHILPVLDYISQKKRNLYIFLKDIENWIYLIKNSVHAKIKVLLKYKNL